MESGCWEVNSSCPEGKLKRRDNISISQSCQDTQLAQYSPVNMLIKAWKPSSTEDLSQLTCFYQDFTNMLTLSWMEAMEVVNAG